MGPSRRSSSHLRRNLWKISISVGLGEGKSHISDASLNSNGAACEHKCTIPCHPGPCPKCPVMVQQSCFCGRVSRQVRCSTDVPAISCESACGKLLACGLHACALTCHSGQCEPCALTETQRCFCGRHTREAKCGEGLLDASIGLSDSSRTAK